MAPIFGTDDIAIEPSVFAWHLDPPAGDQSAAGNNGFHLPHRDFSHTETFAPDGSLSTLSVWIPLTDARIDNGCMYALPKEFDAEHDKPEKATHLRAAVDKGDGGVEIRFPLQAARPLVGPAGSLMAWHGNTVRLPSSQEIASRTCKAYCSWALGFGLWVLGIGFWVERFWCTCAREKTHKSTQVLTAECTWSRRMILGSQPSVAFWSMFRN
jgi:hypothetical protein